jgi:diguanylate cyclase (GGDEF)-like protein
MPPAPIPKYDDTRLAVLARYNILDTAGEEIFDRITLMARSLFNSRIALVSLIDRDRQWFKSHVGLDAQETPRDQAFCGYAILQREPLIVEDATKDPRFSDNPLVKSEPNIRFYAGAQLVTHDGHALGTLCILDQAPRQLQEADVRLLKELATIAMNEIELRILKADSPEKKKFENRDASTGAAFNTHTFQKLFLAECARAQRLHTPLSLAVMELDHLQSVEDTLGPDAVNAVICAFGEACKAVSRSQDILARISRNGFAFLMPNTKSASGEIIVRRILKRVSEEKPTYDDGKISYSVSIGLSQMADQQRAQDFLKDAEKNRVAAKSSGRNEYVASFAA